MSKRGIVVAGITVNVFNLDNQEDGEDGTESRKPVAILFLLHGRESRADSIELVAKAFLDEVSARRKDPEQATKEVHDSWIVTFVSDLCEGYCMWMHGLDCPGFAESWAAVGG